MDEMPTESGAGPSGRMPAQTLERSMGRKKAGGKELPERDDKAIKFDRTLADKASYVCARRRAHDGGIPERDVQGSNRG